MSAVAPEKILVSLKYEQCGEQCGKQCVKHIYFDINFPIFKTFCQGFLASTISNSPFLFFICTLNFPLSANIGNSIVRLYFLLICTAALSHIDDFYRTFLLTNVKIVSKIKPNI